MAFITCRSVIFQGGWEEMRAKYKSIVRDRLKEALKYWQATYLPMHFGEKASRRYSYKTRTVSYLRRKAKKLGLPRPEGKSRSTARDSRPLEFTGNTMMAAMLPVQPTASLLRATLTLPVPWYVKMVPKTRNAPSLGEELLRVLPAEARDIEEKLKRAVEADLNAVRGHEVRRIA